MRACMLASRMLGVSSTTILPNPLLVILISSLFLTPCLYVWLQVPLLSYACMPYHVGYYLLLLWGPNHMASPTPGVRAKTSGWVRRVENGCSQGRIRSGGCVVPSHCPITSRTVVYRARLSHPMACPAIPCLAMQYHPSLIGYITWFRSRPVPLVRSLVRRQHDGMMRWHRSRSCTFLQVHLHPALPGPWHDTSRHVTFTTFSAAHTCIRSVRTYLCGWLDVWMAGWMDGWDGWALA